MPRGHRLTNVASLVGLNFQQGSFRFGISNDYRAMMGGGVCWVDYNDDGWLDLFAVNSYASADAAGWETNGGLPRTALFENVHGSFRDVSSQAHADLAIQGDGCVAADLNGDGRTDLLVTTTSGVDLLWNKGDGSFTEGARAAGLNASGWYTGAAVADVNGDGRPDVFVAGYSDPNVPVPNSVAGFPTNLAGIRDLLYLNEGNDSAATLGSAKSACRPGSSRLRRVTASAPCSRTTTGTAARTSTLQTTRIRTSSTRTFPGPGGAAADPAGLGFRFEERGVAEGVADGFAGMGIATNIGANGRPDLFVTNSRNEPSAAFRGLADAKSPAFANARPTFDQALGTGFAGWGASWVDLWNTGSPDLVLAAGAIPVTKLSNDAEPVRVLSPVAARGTQPQYGDARDVLGSAGLRLNGRGLAAADVNNDGRMNIAINTIGGKLALLRPTGTSGHWLDVQLSTFSPGALVTVVLPDGQRLVRQVQAGSSYLSSEDPRLHFGLGNATKGPPGDGSLPVGRREPLRRRQGRPGRQGLRAGAGDHEDDAEHNLVPARELHPGRREGTLGRTALGRGGGRRAPGGSRHRAGPGSRPVPPLRRDVGRLGCVRPEGARLLRHREDAGDGRAGCARRNDQLRGLPPPALACVVQREPRLDVCAADQALALALLLARLHEHRGRFPGSAREPHRSGRNRVRPERRFAGGAALRGCELRRR